MSKKRKRTILLAALLAVLLFAGVWLSGAGREIGFISAREGYVELYDGRIYGPCEDDFRAADRGRLLGRLAASGWYSMCAAETASTSTSPPWAGESSCDSPKAIQRQIMKSYKYN